MAENNAQLSPEDLALIKGYYEKIIQLVRYNKNKDEAIDRISKENEHYRSDFAQWVYKPLAMSLISMRENCKRELAGMGGREYAADKLCKNFGYLADELNDIILNNGGDITEDGVLYEGKNISEPFAPHTCDGTQAQETAEEAPATETASETVAEAAQEAAAAEAVAEAPAAEVAETTVEAAEETAAEEVPAPTLAEVLEGYQKQITQILADNTRLEKNLQEALARNADIDDEYKFKLVYPVMREIYKYISDYRDRNEWLYDGGEPTDAEEDKEIGNDPVKLKDRYMAELASVIEKMLDILVKIGVSTVNNTDDKFDPTCQQVSKNILTDVEENDKKIAEYVTDGYIQGGKLIYRQKVNIYKFKK